VSLTLPSPVADIAELIEQLEEIVTAPAHHGLAAGDMKEVKPM